VKERITRPGAIRKLYFSDEFSNFFAALPSNVRKKYDYTMDAVECIYAVPEKFIKKLHGTDLYEMRVAVGTNAWRTVLFAMDHDNIIEATKIVLLNSFLKKSSSDYRKEIAAAEQMLKDMTL
jgi:phage-related protein